MHRIRCPWCGTRDEAEYQYWGDATVKPAELDADIDSAYEATYVRKNPKGWHVEWWHHVSGCRQFVKVVRNTVTHEIAVTGNPKDDLEVPR